MKDKKQKLQIHLEKLVVRAVYTKTELRKIFKEAVLNELAKKGMIHYYGSGFYFRPDYIGETVIPPALEVVIKKYLGTDKFIFRNISDFNSLGLGLTQVFVTTIVYNEKISGKRQVGRRTVEFKKMKFPIVNHDEFLVIDFLNNIESTGENILNLLERFESAWTRRVWPLDYVLIYEYGELYGKKWVKEFLRSLKDESYDFSWALVSQYWIAPYF